MLAAKAMVGGVPLEVTADNFDEVVLREDDSPVLVDFWAPWCEPCRTMEPVLAELADDLAGSVVIAKVNVDEQPDLAAATRVHALPTLHLILRGKLVDVMLGVQVKSHLVQKLRCLVKAR